ncbi:MAG: hypothetical protein JEZ07_09410 [Phycisphaerae bacterium]|nr:hypothetical protein [Phycisphaerae bacterium]
MGPTLSSLVELQAVEQKLRTTLNKLNKGKKAILRQQHLINQFTETLQAKREEIKQTKMHYDRLDLDLKTREEEVAKLRISLNSAKTNKEYSAVLTQINTTKADTSKLEDQMLALMSQLESDQAECTELEGKIAQCNENLEKLQAKLTENQDDIQSEVDVYKKGYDEKLKAVPAKYQDMFERLAERYEGEVIAEVTHSGGKRSEQSCCGCYMTVPLEVVNSLMGSNDVILTCPSCGRILAMR